MSSGDPETRRRILQETWRLMEAQHGQGVRIEDIAKAAGVSRQAVYLHFGNRADLLIATTHHADEVCGLEERLQKYRAAHGREVLDTYIEFWGNYIPDVYGLAKSLRTVRETDEAANAAWNDRMAAVRRGCRRAIEGLARDGDLSPEWTTDTASDMLWSMLSIAVWENLVIECGWPTARYVTHMQTAARRAFTNA
jgi:AcrR family transcriptional regulator